VAVSEARLSRRQQRRAANGRPAAPTLGCAVAGCEAPGAVPCASCRRTLCRRHAGSLHESGPARLARASGGAPAVRCALCRLEERRRGQAVVRRLWWGAAGAGFALIIAIAFRSNPKQGVALAGLAVLIVLLALIYDRVMRRH